MKVYTRFLPLALVVAVFLTYSGCGPKPGPEPSVQEVQLGKLKSTWKISDVKQNNAPKLTDYPQFTLVITGEPTDAKFLYTTTGRPTLSPWPSSGTWTFGADPAADVVRDGDKPNEKIDIKYSVSDTQLELNFTFSGTGYSNRTSNVTGQWVFTFTK